MHVQMLGHTQYIDEFEAVISDSNGKKIQIYGASVASQFAHLNYPKEAVNEDVFLNADNYAYLAINYHARARWPGALDPFNFLDNNEPILPQFRRRSNRRDLQGRQTGDSIIVNEANDDLPIQKWPRNCVWDADPMKVKCEPIRMDYTEYVADLGVLE
jgi:hypothetical protein